jgi:monoamine oxidase
VEVLEADTDRLGGRIFTRRVRRKDRQDLVYELGGEWIGKSHKRVTQLCDDFGLTRMLHRYSFAFVEEGKPSRFYPHGTLPFSPAENAAFARLQDSARNMDSCQEKELDWMDWWTKVAELGFSTKSLLRQDLMDSTDFGESIRHTSAFVGATEYTVGSRYDEMDEKVVGGNDRLIHALVDAMYRKSARAMAG